MSSLALWINHSPRFIPITKPSAVMGLSASMLRQKIIDPVREEGSLTEHELPWSDLLGPGLAIRQSDECSERGSGGRPPRVQSLMTCTLNPSAARIRGGKDMSATHHEEI